MKPQTGSQTKSQAAIKCPMCKVECELTETGLFLNHEQCAALAKTEFAVRPAWCPRLSDAAPQDVHLMPEQYRARIEAAIAANKTERG